MQRYYIAPSYVTAKPGEAEALDLLMKIAGSGSTSRIYKKLVVESKLASSAGGDYSGYGLDGGTISLYAVAADGVALPKVEAAIDDVLADIVKNGVTDAELARAKTQLSRRLHLRQRQPGDAGSPLRLEPRGRAHRRRRRRLAGRDLESNGGRRQEGRGEVSRSDALRLRAISFPIKAASRKSKTTCLLLPQTAN